MIYLFDQNEMNFVIDDLHVSIFIINKNATLLIMIFKVRFLYLFLRLYLNINIYSI